MQKDGTSGYAFIPNVAVHNQYVADHRLILKQVSLLHVFCKPHKRFTSCVGKERNTVACNYCVLAHDTQSLDATYTLSIYWC